ncbi:uncharacterized protein [Oscarella lobularis]|uniref:uncharacterized protein n=1 Tax=Oscarella lobularis TaxID=121494 RepID=UPI0033135B0F
MAVFRSSFGGAAAKTFERIADIHDSPTPYRAEFHAKIDLLSEMKSKGSTKYFHGFLADETGRIRFVSFYPAKRDKFAEYARAGEAICFRNVIVKRSKIGSDMEVEIQDNSGLGKSPQKIAVATHVDHNPEVPVRATLNEIGRFLPGQLIDVKAKVVELTDVNVTRTQVEVVKAAIADGTGFATLTIWGGDMVEKVRLLSSYDFRVCVKAMSESDGHQLFTPRVGAQINAIENLHNVVTVPFSLGEKPSTLKDAKVISAGNFDVVYKCPSCNKGNTSPVEPHSEYCRCSSCGDLSLLEACDRETRTVLTIKSQSIKLHLTADSQQMEAICQKPLDLIERSTFLRAPKFTLKYTADRRIVAVFRHDSCQDDVGDHSSTSSGINAGTTFGITTAASSEVAAASSEVAAAASSDVTVGASSEVAAAVRAVESGIPNPTSARRRLAKSFSVSASGDAPKPMDCDDPETKEPPRAKRLLHK